MAKIVNCWFCNQSAPNHDHDNCARKYGEPVDRNFLEMAADKGTVIAAEHFRKEFNSPNYQAYKLYRERQKQHQLTQDHMDGIKRNVETEVSRILKVPGTLKSLESHNIPNRHNNFKVTLSVVVTVVPEPVY